LKDKTKFKFGNEGIAPGIKQNDDELTVLKQTQELNWLKSNLDNEEAVL